MTVTGENDWQVPLHIDSWTYGEPAAQPAFGTAAFFYAASPESPFQPEVPIHSGTWYVQAIVEEPPQYTGLESVASFEIYPARPEYLAPNMKSATYGDYLADVSLESQFFWENGNLRVGNVSPYDGTRLPFPRFPTAQKPKTSSSSTAIGFCKREPTTRPHYRLRETTSYLPFNFRAITPGQ